jgi:hypothetical protein
MENIHLAQYFERMRGVGDKSEKELQTEHVKSERFRNQCEGVAVSLSQLDAIMSE